MSIESALKEHLSPLVGGRVYPLQLPSTPTLPSITYQRIDTAPMLHRGNPNPDFGRPRFQLDGWASTFGNAVTLRGQIRGQMATFSQTDEPRVDVALLKDDRDIFESTPGRWRCSLDYHIWAEES